MREAQRAARRPLPSGLGAPSDDPDEPVSGRVDFAWLRPLPDSLHRLPEDPADTVAGRQSVRLAFVAALQLLPPRQRAMLLIRDVLAWSAAEAAELIGTTESAVRSGLQRARAQLKLAAPAEEMLFEPESPEQRRLLDAYADAFERADVETLLGLLTRDARWEMPPIPAWFVGTAAIGRFLTTQVLAAGRFRLVPTAANAQPAFVVYQTDGEGQYVPHGLQVLSLAPEGIAGIVTFRDPGLFATFGLPAAVAAR